MLNYCAHPSRLSMSLLIRHDDKEREYAYDAGSEEALKQANNKRWTIVSMENDWSSVFAMPRDSVTRKSA
jgi:hypothetical protein